MWSQNYDIQVFLAWSGTEGLSLLLKWTDVDGTNTSASIWCQSDIVNISSHMYEYKHSKFSTLLSCNFITFSNQNRRTRKGIPSYNYSWNLKIQWKKKTNLLDCNSCSALTKDKISLILNLHDDCHLGGKKQYIILF